MSLSADRGSAARSAARGRRPSAGSSSCRSPTARAGRRTSPAGSSGPACTAVNVANDLVRATELEVAASCSAHHARRQGRRSRLLYFVSSAAVRPGRHWPWRGPPRWGRSAGCRASSGSSPASASLVPATGRDVVDPGRDLRHDLGVVVVVDQLLGVLLVLGEARDDEVVATRACSPPAGRAYAAVVVSSCSDTMSPSTPTQAAMSPLAEAVGVLVAGEALELAGVLGLLQHVDRGVEVGVGEVAPGPCPGSSITRPTCRASR